MKSHKRCMYGVGKRLVVRVKITSGIVRRFDNEEGGRSSHCKQWLRLTETSVDAAIATVPIRNGYFFLTWKTLSMARWVVYRWQNLPNTDRAETFQSKCYDWRCGNLILDESQHNAAAQQWRYGQFTVAFLITVRGQFADDGIFSDCSFCSEIKNTWCKDSVLKISLQIHILHVHHSAPHFMFWSQMNGDGKQKHF